MQFYDRLSIEQPFHTLSDVHGVSSASIRRAWGIDGNKISKHQFKAWLHTKRVCLNNETAAQFTQDMRCLSENSLDTKLLRIHLFIAFTIKIARALTALASLGLLIVKTLTNVL